MRPAHVLAATLMSVAASDAHALGSEEMVAILKTIDARQRNNGDYKSLVYIEQKERDKNTLVYQVVVYRRDEDDKLMILFLKPKAEAGKGYLRIDKNLFMYDPATGRWERRTERERIGGTDSRRTDFDDSNLAEEYAPEYLGLKKLGKFKVHHLKLKARADADVAFPVVEVWVDKETTNVLKRQEFALSGRLMRTSYYPRWEKKFSRSKNAEVYFPKQIRIFDEVVKGNKTTIVLRNVDLDPLDPNMFTKAWLESKSR